MIESSGLTVGDAGSGDLPDDVAGTSEALAAAQAELVAIETRQLRLAAHWIDLHSPEGEPDVPSSSG